MFLGIALEDLIGEYPEKIEVAAEWKSFLVLSPRALDAKFLGVMLCPSLLFDKLKLESKKSFLRSNAIGSVFKVFQRFAVIPWQPCFWIQADLAMVSHEMYENPEPLP